MLDLTLKTLRYMDAIGIAAAAGAAPPTIPAGAQPIDYAAALADAESVDPGTLLTDARKATIAAADANAAKLLAAAPATPEPPTVTAANARNPGRPSLALTRALLGRAAAGQAWTLGQVRAAETEVVCAADGASPTAAQAADVAAAVVSLGSATVPAPAASRQTPNTDLAVPATGGATLTAAQVAQINSMFLNLHGSLRSAGILPS